MASLHRLIRRRDNKIRFASFHRAKPTLQKSENLALLQEGYDKFVEGFTAPWLDIFNCHRSGEMESDDDDDYEGGMDLEGTLHCAYSDFFYRYGVMPTELPKEVIADLNSLTEDLVKDDEGEPEDGDYEEAAKEKLRRDVAGKKHLALFVAVCKVGDGESSEEEEEEGDGEEGKESEKEESQ